MISFFFPMILKSAKKKRFCQIQNDFLVHLHVSLVLHMWDGIAELIRREVRLWSVLAWEAVKGEAGLCIE